MRKWSVVLVAVLAATLVISSGSMAVAKEDGRGGSHGREVKTHAEYRVSKPGGVHGRVTTGVAFETTGSVSPMLSADDTATVEIRVYGPKRRGHAVLVGTFPASLVADPDSGRTIYSASVTIAAAGQYSLSAVLVRDGGVVARSALRTVKAMLPYKVSKPSSPSPCPVEGASFEVTGSIGPALPEGSGAIVTVFAYRIGAHGRLSEVASVTATFTGPAGMGTGYSATLSLSPKGKYALLAVLSEADAVLGKSAVRKIRVVADPALVVAVGRRSAK